MGSQSAYVLSAIPLNSDLSDTKPFVSNNQIKNNVMDFGEGVYWITRYNGYFYANGEIIKYDAVEYSVPGVGNVWINNVQEYEYYFAKLPFNGKIYPTGLVRIYSEPNYEEVQGVLRLKNGEVSKHGRGQFGTTPVYHVAGLNPYWADNANVRGCTMRSEFLFNPLRTTTLTNVNSTGSTLTVSSTSSISVGQQLTMLSGTGKLSTIQKTLVIAKPTETTLLVSPAPTTALLDATIYFETLVPTTIDAPAGINNTLAQQTTRNGIIKNFFASNYIEDSKVRAMLSTQSGTLQSSALVMTGPGFTSTEKPRDFVSYVYKKLTDKFTHFGTRIRIVGKIENDASRGQTPVGSTAYFVIPGTTPDKDISIIGGSGGMAVMINPESNSGYKAVNYISDMATAYLAADLIIARSGAVTCAEVNTLGRYALFIPLPIGNGEQNLNAASLVSQGRAEILPQALFTAEWMSQNMRRLLAQSSAAPISGSTIDIEATTKIVALMDYALSGGK